MNTDLGRLAPQAEAAGQTGSLPGQGISLPPTPVLRGFGMCTHFARRDIGWKIERLLPLMKDLGVSVVRTEILWDTVELQEGLYAIPAVDREWLDALRDAGIQLLLLLCYGNPIYANPMDPEAFAAYCSWMVRELKDYPLTGVEIWNEPTNFQFTKHYGGNWSGIPPCPWADRFAELVQISSAAIRKANPRMPILTNPGDPQFFQMVQAHPEAFRDLDGVGTHPYACRFPPETVPWGGEQIHQRDGVTVADDDHSFLSLLRRTREFGMQHLARELEIHATEFGYTTYNHHRKPGMVAGYTETAQAMYLLRGMILGFAGGARTMCVYDLMDDGPDLFEQEDNFGIVRTEAAGYAPKLAYFALRRLAQWLGPDWAFVPVPPAVLETEIKPLPQNQDNWQKPVVEPHLTITEPQAYWFRVGNDWITFVWRAGRNDGEYQAPLGRIVWENAPLPIFMEALDLVTGQPVEVNILEEGSMLVVDNVPVGGAPIGIRWREKSKLHSIKKMSLHKI